MSAAGQLLLLFAGIGLVAIGGVNAVLPEMQRQVVAVHHWMTAPQFAALFALAQAAPGPNLLVATLVGWEVAGLAGAGAATAGIALPSCLLTFAAAGTWHRFRAARWRSVAQRGLTPVTVGLVIAASILLARAASAGWAGRGLTAAATLALLRTRVHPLWVLAAGTACGLAGLV